MIEQEHGTRAIVRFLEGYRDGKTTDQLIPDILGMDVAAFDRHFNAYLERRFSGPLAAIGAPKPADRPESRQDVERRALNRDNYLAQVAMGELLLEEGDLDAALPYLERAKALFPEYAGPDSPSWLLARIHQRRGDNRRAIAELQSLVTRNSQHYAALVTLAGLLEATGDSTGAADMLDRTMYVWPLDLDVHRRLATMAAGQKRWDRVIRERRAVLALNPVDRADALYQLARAQLAAGDATGARRSVLQALERAPNFPAAQELLLSIHEKNREN
jgi:tetratricopeptide (TPR) repeat protein